MIARLEETQMGMYSELRSCHHSAHATWLFLVGPLSAGSPPVSCAGHLPGAALCPVSVQTPGRRSSMAVLPWLLPVGRETFFFSGVPCRHPGHDTELSCADFYHWGKLDKVYMRSPCILSTAFEWTIQIKSLIKEKEVRSLCSYHVSAVLWCRLVGTLW